jgi:hypothetical protein
MGTDRPKQLLLAGLLVAIGLFAYRSWTQTSAAPASTSNQQGARGAPAASGRKQADSGGAPEVHLNALEDERPKPEAAQRNLFRFKPKPPPPPPPPPPAPIVAPPPVPTGPPPVPPPPPITLEFIGVLDRGEGQPKIAVLTDGVGPPLYAAEGQTVAGRYRILRIGAESIEMAYLDGRGRQTIRLSGS